MSFPSINPTKTKAWTKLQEHLCAIEKMEMKEMFQADSLRVEKFHIKWKNFLLDYSKNRIDENTKNTLIELANEVGLKEAIQSYFAGHNINKTENRAVLHVALRAKQEEVYLVDKQNVVKDVFAVKEKIKSFSEKVINGSLKGYSGKAFTDVINIGIGGSDLGPAMVVDGLSFYKNHLNTHFISNVDEDYTQQVLKRLNPETTLVIIVSKTFTTKETITNANIVRDWLLHAAKNRNIANHFAGVTSSPKTAQNFGILPNNIFPIWDWVGGRFSVWSAVGLSVSLNLGYENFEKLLNGANEMDMHFKETPFEENIPVILALLGIWNNNFLNAETEAIIPYSQFLQKFAPYLQQSVMESNGKNIDRNGDELGYQTSTIVWGEPGTNAQHAFFQLFHQGTKLIPVDFIGFKYGLNTSKGSHNEFMANFFAQSEALLMGKTIEEVVAELKAQDLNDSEIKELSSFKVFKGNKPSNTILIDKLTPESLGALIALYEHKIFVQGVVWNIFSYDQWGVELGKKLASSILDELNSNEVQKHDASTTFLINQFKN